MLGKTYSEFSWTQNVWKIISSLLDSFPRQVKPSAKCMNTGLSHGHGGAHSSAAWNRDGIWSVPGREAARPRACLCSHSHRVCFCLVFIWEKNVVMISTTTHPPPPNHSIPIAETLRENLLCVTKKYVFSLCYRPWIASRAPPFPGGQLSSFMICISLPYTEPSEKLSEPAEWWELKVACKKSPFSSSFCTESALPEI